MSGFAILIFITLVYLALNSKAQQMRDGTARERYLEECRRQSEKYGKH